MQQVTLSEIALRLNLDADALQRDAPLEPLANRLRTFGLADRALLADQLVGHWLSIPNANFRAVTVFLEHVLLPDTSPLDNGNVQHVLDALEPVPLETKAWVLARLANTWTQSPHRGPAMALHLLAAWLEWSLDPRTSDSELEGLTGTGVLGQVTPEAQALIVCILLSVLSLSGRQFAGLGFRIARAWWQVAHLPANGSAPGDAPLITRVTGARRTQLFAMAMLSALNSGQMAPAQIVSEVIRYLGLPSVNMSQVLESCALLPAQAQVQEAHGSIQGNLINLISSCLRHLDPRETARHSLNMCLAWLGMEDRSPDAITLDALSQAMQRPPFVTAHIVDRANIVCAMAIAARHLSHLDEPLSILLAHAFLGGDPLLHRHWPPAHLSGIDPVSFIHVINQLFVGLDWKFPSTRSLLDRVMAYLSSLVLQQPTDQDAELLYTRVSVVLDLPARLLVGDKTRADFLNDRNMLGQLYKWELIQSERVRNLRLLRRLMAVSAPHGQGSHVTPTLDALCVPHSPPSSSPAFLQCNRPSDAEAARPPSSGDHAFAAGQSKRFRSAHDLDQVIDDALPEDCIYLSTTFLGKGELQWIATYRPAASETSNVLAQGRSLPGAFNRLIDATAQFDLECEAVSCPPIRNGDVRSDLELTLAMLDASIKRGQDIDPGLLDFAVFYCGNNGRPVLAENLRLWADTRNTPAQQSDVDALQRRTMSALFAATQAAPYTPADALDRLDHAAGKLITAIETDFPLTSLHRALRTTRLHAHRQHLLVQLQGPLASLPIELSAFGAETLCEAVASITHVPSLAAWSYLPQKKRHRTENRLFSGVALDHDSNESMASMIQMQASLAALCRKHQWNGSFAGDTPACSPEAVSRILGDPTSDFPLAILCAHGASGHQSGVQLKGGKLAAGAGQLASVETLFLVACSVGRLGTGVRDTYGFTADMLVSGVSSVIAASWPIVASDALASLVCDFAQRYLESALDLFSASTRVNEIRREALFNRTPEPGHLHTVAAFQCFGRG